MSQRISSQPLSADEYARGYHEAWESEWHEAAEAYKREFNEPWSHKTASEWLDRYRSSKPFWERNKARICSVCASEIENLILKGVMPHLHAQEVRSKLRALAVKLSGGMTVPGNRPTKA